MNTIDLIYIKLLGLNLSNDIIKIILKFLYCEYPGCKDIIYKYYRSCLSNVFIIFGAGGLELFLISLFNFTQKAIKE